MFYCRCCLLNFVSFEREIFELRPQIGVKFCTMISRKLNFIVPVQNFNLSAPPRKFWGQKRAKLCQIWLNFG